MVDSNLGHAGALKHFPMVIMLALEAMRLPFLIKKRKDDVTLITREKDLLSLLYEGPEPRIVCPNK